MGAARDRNGTRSCTTTNIRSCGKWRRDYWILLEAKPGERILDLGCGTGPIAAEIAAKGATVVGVDRSPEMIQQARKNYPALRFEVMDAREIAFAEPFDAVLSNATLHWIKEPETGRRRNREGAEARRSICGGIWRQGQRAGTAGGGIERAWRKAGPAGTGAEPVVLPERRRVLGDFGEARAGSDVRESVRTADAAGGWRTRFAELAENVWQCVCGTSQRTARGCGWRQWRKKRGRRCCAMDNG